MILNNGLNNGNSNSNSNHNSVLYNKESMKKIYIPKKDKAVTQQLVLYCCLAFLFGCLATLSFVMNLRVDSILNSADPMSLSTSKTSRLLCPTSPGAASTGQLDLSQSLDLSTTQQQQPELTQALRRTESQEDEEEGEEDQKPIISAGAAAAAAHDDGVVTSEETQNISTTITTRLASIVSKWSEPGHPKLQVQSILQNVRILVAVAAFDFSQLPHLEEVVDSYHDVCMAGAVVHVVIHATVAYPVTLIDLWNTRYMCEGFTIQIALKPKTLRLHLVDCHRELFYQNLDHYDLFIYTEDDIRVTPTNVATYLYETIRLHQYLRTTTKTISNTTTDEDEQKYKPSDFNVGIVRYEYNYPANVIIDDKTRHATQNVTRVYWEHSTFERPVVPNCVNTILEEKEPYLASHYFTMTNHHQGMFLATRELLVDWRDRCNFHIARNRPGAGHQPTEGTQRVWMSSQMLYGKRHCNVQQVLPKHSNFGALTVWHLPNKNYRRVGKYRKRVFPDGTETFETPHESLLTAMELHLGMRKAWPPEPMIPYQGTVTMVDEQGDKDRTPLLERRLSDYLRYVERGGVLHEQDFAHTALDEER